MKKIYLPLFLLIISIVNSQEIKKDEAQKSFSTSEKMYNSWSVSAYIGTPLIQSGDLTSIDNGAGDWDFGYDVQLGLTKSFTHSFSLALQAQMGETKQQNLSYKYEGHTEYMGLMLLGDINLSNLLKRIDNKKEFKWALHAFAGAGFIGYKAYSNVPTDLKTASGVNSKEALTLDQDFGLESFYAQAGAELKYKLSPRFDLGLRMAYYSTGDETFDGSGNPASNNVYGTSPADIEEGRSDNFITTSLGLTYKIGKHKEHLLWVDPLQELYKKIDNIKPVIPEIPPVCVKGDQDNDGVCDDWDKCLNTPQGARIDGSGCPLDVDLDGVFDYEDACVVVPGERTSDPKTNGCPKFSMDDFDNKDYTDLKGIQFNLNSIKIRTISKPILDNAADVIMNHANGKRFIVEGHTDSRASENYNLKLSLKRTQAVVNYLVNKGVTKDQLVPVGKGESDLLYPECVPAKKCPEWKNEANRRVVFKIIR